MTSSANTSDLVLLFPEATAEDRAALRRAARYRATPDAWAKFLEHLPPPSVEELRRRPISRGEPFRLDA